MATFLETPRSYVVGRLSPHQIAAVRSRLAQQVKRTARKGAERRQDPRFAIDEPARMKVLQPIGPSSVIRILDISRSGLKISVAEFLAPGTVIQIHLKASVAFAEVRFCTAQGEGFHAGVQFQDVFWTNPPK